MINCNDDRSAPARDAAVSSFGRVGADQPSARWYHPSVVALGRPGPQLNSGPNWEWRASSLPPFTALFDQLAEIVDAVGDRIDVFMDGGVQRGACPQRALGRRQGGWGRPRLSLSLSCRRPSWGRAGTWSHAHRLGRNRGSPLGRQPRDGSVTSGLGLAVELVQSEVEIADPRQRILARAPRRCTATTGFPLGDATRTPPARGRPRSNGAAPGRAVATVCRIGSPNPSSTKCSSIKSSNSTACAIFASGIGRVAVMRKRRHRVVLPVRVEVHAAARSKTARPHNPRT